MDCTYSININGTVHTLLTGIDAATIKGPSDLIKVLKTLPIERLKELISTVNVIDHIEQIDLSNINENSVGLYSPASLIDYSFRSIEEKEALSKLPIDKKLKNSNIVIAGFGNESVQTQYFKNHIFLNLNYTSDKDNKVIALTELALHSVDTDNYEANSAKLRTSDNQDVLELLTKGVTKDTTKTTLQNMIRLAYQKTQLRIHQDLSESNITTERQSQQVLADTFIPLAYDKADLNYQPKTTIAVEYLKPGDLVLVPVEPVLKNGKETEASENFRRKYKNGVYEIFQDSYVDIDGNTILRTLFKVNDTEFGTRKRIASRSVKKDDTYVVQVSNKVEARIQNSEIISGFNYPATTNYVKVETTLVKGYVNSESVRKLLSNKNAKVYTADSKTSQEIKTIQGNTITLVGGKTIKYSDIKGLDIPNVVLPEFKRVDDDKVDTEVWQPFKYPTEGEHILFRKTPQAKTLTEGIVIGKGVSNDKEIIIYKTAKIDNKSKQKLSDIGYVGSSNVLYTSAPPTEFQVTTQENMEVQSILTNLFGKNLSSIDLSTVFTSNKEGKFRNSKYSIQEVNKYSPIRPGDLLFFKGSTEISNKVFKVVHSGTDFIKVTGLVNDKNIYFVLDKEALESNYLLFTTNPINETFATQNILKNRYNIYPSVSGQNGQRVRVWKNYNGFTYVLPYSFTKEQREAHQLYEVKRVDGKDIAPVDITDETSKKLAERYKWKAKDYKVGELYVIGTTETTLEVSNTKAKNSTERFNKDIANTKRLEFNNEMFSKLSEPIASTDPDVSLIPPGSLVTFAHNGKAYVVEKAYKNSLLVSYYHYTDNLNDKIKNADLKYVKSEKFFISKNNLASFQITGLYLPNWATEVYTTLGKLKPKTVKSSKVNTLSKVDSPELVTKMIALIETKFGVKITTIHNKDLPNFKGMGVENSAAFVYSGGIYVNLDRASVEEPLHEVLHLILANMKYRDPDTYYRLVNSVQYHPLFETTSQMYNEINTDVLEETFIKLLSSTFRNNIIREGVFDEANFTTAINGAIADMLTLSDSLDWEDSFELLGKPLKDVLFDFSSDLIKNEDGLIDLDNAFFMFSVSDAINQLLDEGKLKQKCNY